MLNFQQQQQVVAVTTRNSVDLLAGQYYMDYLVVRLHLDSANPGIVCMDKDDNWFYLKFDRTDYESKVHGVLSDSKYISKILPVP